MPDYKKLYALVVGSASDAPDLLAQDNAQRAAFVLRQGLLWAEERILCDEDSSASI